MEVLKFVAVNIFVVSVFFFGEAYQQLIIGGLVSCGEMQTEIRYSCGRAQYGIEEMCRDQWNWAKKNPYGYCGSAEK